MYATGEKLNITQIEGQIPQAPLPKEVREDFVKDWIQIPTGKEEKFKQFIMDWGEEGKTFPNYKFKGWNNEGIPTKETLDELGLDYASKDLELRGILKNEKSQVNKYRC